MKTLLSNFFFFYSFVEFVELVLANCNTLNLSRWGMLLVVQFV